MVIYSPEDLESRLRFGARHETRRLAFCIGSAVTAPAIPGVAEAIAFMRESIADSPDDLADFDRVIGHLSGGAAYRAAAELLLGRRGQEALNALIRRMTLNAHRPTQRRLEAGSLSAMQLDDAYCLAAENDISAWELPPAVDALCRLLVEHASFASGPVLTTNFDPLIEIGVRRLGGYVVSESIDSNGGPGRLEAPGGVRVIHLHGYWRQSDTLHVPAQLTAERSILQASLEDLLAERTVLVTGYGAWDDVFAASLRGAISHQNHGSVDVLWTLFESEHSQIEDRYQALVSSVSELPGRISLYSGVNCHSLLPSLAARLGPEKPRRDQSTGGSSGDGDDGTEDAICLLDPRDAAAEIGQALEDTAKLYLVGAPDEEVFEMLAAARHLPVDTVLAVGAIAPSDRDASQGSDISGLADAGVAVFRATRRVHHKQHTTILTDLYAYVTLPHPRHRTVKTVRYQRGTLQYDMVSRSVSQVLTASILQSAA